MLRKGGRCEKRLFCHTLVLCDTGTLSFKGLLTPNFEPTKVQLSELARLSFCGSGAANRSRNDSEVSLKAALWILSAPVGPPVGNGGGLLPCSSLTVLLSVNRNLEGQTSVGTDRFRNVCR